MKLFVTGGTGFIGSQFLCAALAAGHHVRAVRRAGAMPRVPLPREPEWIAGDLASFDRGALRGCEAFVHLAAVGVDAKAATWPDCFRANVDESLTVWIAAADAGIRTFAICGSCFEYGRAGERYERIPVTAPLGPTGPYHASKAAATMAALGFAVDRQLALTVLRPFHVFGEGEAPTRFWPSLRAAAQAGADFPMSPGDQIRDFVPVEEVAQAFLRVVQRPPRAGAPEIFNVGTGVPQRLRDFAEHWWREWNAAGRLLPGRISYRPNEVMRYVPELKPGVGSEDNPGSV